MCVIDHVSQYTVYRNRKNLRNKGLEKVIEFLDKVGLLFFLVCVKWVVSRSSISTDVQPQTSRKKFPVSSIRSTNSFSPTPLFWDVGTPRSNRGWGLRPYGSLYSSPSFAWDVGIHISPEHIKIYSLGRSCGQTLFVTQQEPNWQGLNVNRE